MAGILEKISNKILSNPLVQFLFIPLVRNFYSHNHPQVIVRIDGGICSQIHFYLIGRYFSEKGYDVSYDLKWFKECGKDMQGNFVRNFDLKKLVPELPFVESNEIRAKLYHYFLSDNYNYFNDNLNELSWQNLTPPVYLGGYYHDNKELYTELLPKYFQFDILTKSLNEQNILILNKIQSSPSVAVHVRRGDLAIYNLAYGTPCSLNYFIKSICYLKEINKFVYYIFSDEPDWCKNELLPSLPSSETYHIVNVNGSDKGYMDLVLMSACNHFITSKGSLGKFAAFLNKDRDKIVIINDDLFEKKWKEFYANVVEIKN